MAIQKNCEGRMNMVRVFLICCALFASFLQTQNASASEAWGTGGRECAVVDWAWTSKIGSDKNPVEKIVDRCSARILYYWMQIEGNCASLKYLSETKKIPILFKWYFCTATDCYPDRIRRVKITDNEISKLNNECIQNGKWTYRIWDYRYKGGVSKVVPIFPDGSEAICKSHSEDCSSIINHR
jgi:hypothetical protein